MVDASFFGLVILALFAVNAFLYYRWKSLQDEFDERESSKRLDFMKGHVSEFSSGLSSAATLGAVASGNDLLSQAKNSAADLKAILENDLVGLHQKIVSTSEKLA